MLEPGIGTGLFPALMPAELRDRSFVTGVELDPVTARIVRLLQPKARIINGDFARTDLAPIFDLAIGNPPFSDRTVRSDRAYRSLALRLHDYFIARSIDLLKPGALAAFVCSSGTMDKVDATAREHIARTADLIAAIRLPEGSFRRNAGTDVVVDLLFFRKRKTGEAEGDLSWLDLEEVRPATQDEVAIRVNRWFAQHPDFVLGDHALTSGPFGETYTCLARAGEDLEAALKQAMLLLPEGRYDGEPTEIDIYLETQLGEIVDLRPDSRQVREGSFFLDTRHGLMQMVDSTPVEVRVRKGRTGDGMSEKHARIIKKLIPIRDAVRDVLKAQEHDRPWRDCRVRLRIAWSNFVRDFGPINHTTVSISEDEETGEVRETHRRPNLQPFLDDPDCWLVASIEDYDLDTDTAKPGPIFSERVISPPAPPEITSTADALAPLSSTNAAASMSNISPNCCTDIPMRWSTNSEVQSSGILPTAPGRRRMPISPARSAPSSPRPRLPRDWIRPMVRALQDLMWLDQRSCGKLLRTRSRRSLCLRTAADLVNFDRGRAASFRYVVGGLGIVDRCKRDPAGALEPFARCIATAIGLAHLAERLIDHRQRDPVFATRVARGLQKPHAAKAGDLIEEEQRATLDPTVKIVDRVEKRADDDARETRMGLQCLEVEVDEDIAISGGDVAGREFPA